MGLGFKDLGRRAKVWLAEFGDPRLRIDTATSHPFDSDRGNQLHDTLLDLGHPAQLELVCMHWSFNLFLEQRFLHRELLLVVLQALLFLEIRL